MKQVSSLGTTFTRRAIFAIATVIAVSAAGGASYAQ
jgi:hypothetical protein